MKKFGVDLPSEELEKFDQFCRDKGIVKWKAVSASLRLYQLLPPDMRDMLTDPGSDFNEGALLDGLVITAMEMKPDRSGPRRGSADRESAAWRAEQDRRNKRSTRPTD